MESRQFYTRKDKVVLWCGYILLALFSLAVLVPLIYVVLASFIDPVVLTNQGISFMPEDWTLEGYRRVFQDDMIGRGFLNSFLYSTVFAVFSTIICLLAAYPLSLPQFVGRKAINTFFLITMFFGGGLMPTYLLVSNLNLINSPLALILPGAVNVWNIILARTYAKDGTIIAVDDLIDQYMPNLKKVLDENPEYRTLITAPDGHIYSFPWIEELGSGKESIQSIGGIPWINKAWLDELGLAMPTTPRNSPKCSGPSSRPIPTACPSPL